VAPVTGGTESLSSFAGRFVRSLAAATTAGLVIAFVVGGLGGRLVMRILSITSPTTHGAITDNGNRVNELTKGGTIGLVVFVTLFGVVGGWTYLLVRRWMPGRGWKRRLAFAVWLVAVTSPLLIDPNNKDFAILGPHPLPIVLFALLPLAYGLVVAPLTDRLDRFYAGRTATSAKGLAAFLPLLVIGVFVPAIAFVAIAFAVMFAVVRSPRGRALWEGKPVLDAGRVVLALVFAATLAVGAEHAARIDHRPVQPSDYVADR
jgi:hypothetical protein